MSGFDPHFERAGRMMARNPLPVSDQDLARMAWGAALRAEGSRFLPSRGRGETFEIGFGSLVWVAEQSVDLGFHGVSFAEVEHRKQCVARQVAALLAGRVEQEGDRYARGAERYVFERIHLAEPFAGEGRLTRGGVGQPVDRPVISAAEKRARMQAAVHVMRRELGRLADVARASGAAAAAAEIAGLAEQVDGLGADLGPAQ